MVRINLQLFAYKGDSIVDYLKSEGKDSSFSARKKLAESNGIKGYTGSGEQNTQLLNTLRSGSNTNKTPKTTTTTIEPKTQPTLAADTTASNPTLPGVDQADYDKMHSSFSVSDDTTGLKDRADDAYKNYEQWVNKEDIISQDTKDAMNKGFVVPESVLKADTYLDSQLAQIQSGKTSYSDDVERMMASIENRDKFSYDVDSDPLFQQALASAMNSGQSAMQDTIGQASALTGGYGSTYATSAGNQAYNAFIEDAYNNLPEYYNMALQAYQMEGEELYRQLGMYMDADATEYGRMVDAFNATSDRRNQQYGEAFDMWRADKSDAFASANLQLSEYETRTNNAFNLYTAATNVYESAYEKEYNTWADSVQQAYQNATLGNSNYWSQTNFDESVRQYDTSLAEQQRQFNLSRGDENNDGVLSDAERAKLTTTKEGYVTKKDKNGNEVTLKEATEAQKTKALEAYNTGGMDGLNKYLNAVPDSYDKESIATYVGEYGELPLEDRTYTKTKDTTNWFWGVDNNDEVTDQYKNVYRIDELPESIRKDLTSLKKDGTYTRKK